MHSYGWRGYIKLDLNQGQVDEFITVDKKFPLTSWLLDILNLVELAEDDLTWHPENYY